MDSRKSSSNHSLIVTSSSLNHRTFNEEESWDSLQSTILSGHLKDLEENKEELESSSKQHVSSVVVEEEGEQRLEPLPSTELTLSLLEDENILNMNIDALPDVFYDCYSTPNKNVSPARLIVQEEASVKSMNYLSPSNFPSSLSGRDSDYTDSGVGRECTGALLAEMAGDFVNLKDHAQSTPKIICSLSDNLSSASFEDYYASPSGELEYCIELSSTSNAKIKLRLSPKKYADTPYHRIQEEKDDKKAEEEEEDDEKIQQDSEVSSSMPPECHRSPALINSTCKVSQVKKLFEAQTKPNEFIKPQQVANTTTTKSTLPSVAAKRSMIPKQSSSTVVKPSGASLNTDKPSEIPVRKLSTIPAVRGLISNQTFKNASTQFGRDSKSNKSPNNGKSIKPQNSKLLKMQQLQQQKRYLGVFSYQRSSSYSDCTFPTPDSLESSSVRNRSHSDSDVISEISQSRLKYVTIRRYQKPKVTRIHLAKKANSPKVSKIMNRKSLGFVSSPVKPVRELRKMYSPNPAIKGKSPSRRVQNNISKSKIKKVQIPKIIIETFGK